MISACGVDGCPLRLPTKWSAAPSAAAQRRGIDERVVDDRVGRGERGDHLERQAAEPPRPGAGEPDVPGLEVGEVRGEAGERAREPAHKPSRPRKRRW